MVRSTVPKQFVTVRAGSSVPRPMHRLARLLITPMLTGKMVLASAKARATDPAASGSVRDNIDLFGWGKEAACTGDAEAAPAKYHCSHFFR